MALFSQSGGRYSAGRDIVTQVSVVYQDSGAPQSDAMKTLRNLAVSAAIHDSDESRHRSKCHPGTRTSILNSIDQWVSGDGSKPVLWLNGALGAGKSSITQTLAERWKERGILGASFSFSRDAPERNNTRSFAATILYQLAVVSPDIRAHVERAVSSDSMLLEKSMVDQMNYLLIPPIATIINRGEPFPRFAIIIDGLDECSVDYGRHRFEDQQREVLETVARVAQLKLPLQFLITSRPERHICNIFKGHLAEFTFPIVLGGGPEVDRDITVFLRYRFAEIRCKNPYLGSSWPPTGTIEDLVKKASGHFIFPSTAAEYLDSRQINPGEALREILCLAPPMRQKHSEQPFSQLDALYTHVLESVPTKSRKNVADILCLLFVMHLSTPVYDHDVVAQSPEHLGRILLLPSSQIYTDLINLHPILEIPEDHKASPIRFIHASLVDFLANPTRSGAFYAGGNLPMHLQINLIMYTRRFCNLPSFENACIFLLLSLDHDVRHEVDSLLLHDHPILHQFSWWRRWPMEHLQTMRLHGKGAFQLLFHIPSLTLAYFREWMLLYLQVVLRFGFPPLKHSKELLRRLGLLLGQLLLVAIGLHWEKSGTLGDFFPTFITAVTRFAWGLVTLVMMTVVCLLWKPTTVLDMCLEIERSITRSWNNVAYLAQAMVYFLLLFVLLQDPTPLSSQIAMVVVSVVVTRITSTVFDLIGRYFLSTLSRMFMFEDF